MLMYCYEFSEELRKPDRNVKAICALLTSVFLPLSGVDIQHLQDMANVQLLVRTMSLHFSLELPAGSSSSPGLSGWLQPVALKFCPSAISSCMQLVIHESVSCSCLHLSQQAFEALLATLGKGARVEQNVHLQLNHWNASAESDSLSLSPIKPVSYLSFLIGKKMGSCQGLLVSMSLNQRKINNWVK